jgi:hypothetical protein
MAIKTTVAMMVAAAAMLSIGCGGAAHIVRRGSYSGELALTGGTVASMDAAQMAMLEHCGGRVRIVTGDEARTLAAIDPGASAKADGESAPSGERLDYVCVTLAEASR